MPQGPGGRLSEDGDTGRQQPQPPPPGNAGQGNETAGTQICFLHLSATARVRRCENFSAHIVNTICHTACPDAAFLPGRKAFFILYAERTLLKCCATRRGKEKPRRVKDSRDLHLDSSWSGGLGHLNSLGD